MNRVKIYEQNLATGSSVSTSSGTGGAYVLSPNKFVRWESVGSDDTTDETVEIQFTGAKTINRLFVILHNLKTYNLQYWNGTAWIDFVHTLLIDENNVIYIEFASISTTKIRIIGKTTIVANEEKHINIVIATLEIGRFNGFIARPSVVHNNNLKVIKVESGKRHIQRGFDAFSCDLDMQYTDADDYALLDLLFQRTQPFLLWLCGGCGDIHFNVRQRGWRLEDVYKVYFDNKQSANYWNDITTLHPKVSISLTEVV